MKISKVKSSNISIHTESFGSYTDPCILLIMGATAQGIMWDQDFCQQLADKGFFVIRYDHRDTGQSSRVDYNKDPYLLSDLALDALAILDHYEIVKANFIAASMGSFISQWIAIKYPERVQSLCLIMSSPNHHAFIDGFEGRDTSHHDLPPSNPKILEFYQKIVGISGASTGSDMNQLYREIWLKIESHESEELINLRVNEGKILRRLKNEKYIHNHSLALANSPSLTKDLNAIKAPTILIHGELDYILPVEHALKLRNYLHGCSLRIYKNMGHGFSSSILSKVMDDFIAFKKYELT